MLKAAFTLLANVFALIVSGAISVMPAARPERF